MPNPKDLVRPLLDWFTANARDLPWRKTKDPYAIWISEIMLQQTQVKTVIPYWERWMNRFPNVHHLASARLDDIYKFWEGLGYYSRARNLHRAAQIIEADHGGVFPSDYDELIELPGIGRYTAGAICSIAFDQPKPVLDGNVIRVLTRLFAIRQNPRLPITNRRLWELAEASVVFAGTHGLSCAELNQALMELGATVCAPRKPNCPGCPVQKNCRAHHTGVASELPNLGPRVVSTERRFVAFVVAAGRRFLVRRRSSEVVNGRLWEFPNLETTKSRFDLGEVALSCLGFRPAIVQPFLQLRHTITRYRIRLEVFYGEVPEAIAPEYDGVRWCKLKQLDRLAFPSAHRRIVDALKEQVAST